MYENSLLAAENDLFASMRVFKPSEEPEEEEPEYFEELCVS
jgi:hypothetical protein